MCKNFAITNMRGIKVTSKLISTIKNVMIKNDGDGFGYSILGNSGEIWGEKFSDVNFACLNMGLGKSIEEMYKPLVKDFHEVWGSYEPKDNLCGIFHSRLATGKINIQNTHPFIGTDKGLHMIHNGVVHDYSKLYDKFCETTCDSEYILRAYESGGVEKIASTISGWYAAIFLRAKEKDLLIVKDNTRLSMTYVDELNTHLIATTADILDVVCKEMKWKRRDIVPLRSNISFNINPDGDYSFEKITPKRYQYNTGRYNWR